MAAATLSDNSLRQTVHTHRASVHQAAKLVAALLRVAGVTAGLAESNGSLPLNIRKSLSLRICIICKLSILNLDELSSVLLFTVYGKSNRSTAT